MLWLLVERLVQVSDHDIGMPWNVKEIREDLDRLPIFHLRLWRLCLNLLLRCFNPCVRDNLRRVRLRDHLVDLRSLLPRPFEGLPIEASRTAGGVELVVAVTPKMTA